MVQRAVEDDESHADENEGLISIGRRNLRPVVMTVVRSRLDIAAITREMHELCGEENNNLGFCQTLSQEKKEQLFTLILKFTYAQLQEAQQEKFNACEIITRQNEERRMKDIADFLRDQRVIAATTTAAATFINALRGAGVKVVIVEEAAEVLEAHTLSMLTSGVEHLVLIGDHKQLRPKVENHTIARHHGLAVSMMERLVRMGMPFVTLTCQRRMHPTISEITKKYYRVCPQQPVLITDHPTTLQRSVALGISCNYIAGHVVVIAHDHECTMHASSDSPMNYHEAESVLSTASFLSSHFVDSKRITVLTPYKGQMFTLQSIAQRYKVPYITSQNNQGIRIAVVDDYQGEESDIVILSLVRTSNAGFLRDERRTCVALSRARCALIVFGNRHVFRKDVSNYLLADLWDAAVKGQFAFGDGRYPACCSKHQRRVAFAKFSEMFEHVGVNGGCKEVCGAQRQCGHSCTAICHPNKEQCDCFNCLEPCARKRIQCTPPRTCDHPCQKKCFEECGKCTFMVNYTCNECETMSQIECHTITAPKCPNVIERAHPRCGDVVTAPCFLWAEALSMTDDETSKKALTALSLACRAICDHQLRCGHRCTNRCADCFKKQANKPIDIHDKVRCNELVYVPNPVCGHRSEKLCGAEVFPECAEPCDKHLPCGHKCSGTCGRCEATGHPACTHMVTIKRTECTHGDVTVECHERNTPCQEPCMHILKCGHQCRGACGICSPSTHFCDKRCGRNLSCGHKCTGSCSRDCPPCKQKCTRGCAHTQCSSKKKPHECGTCIDLCSEECTWKCEHKECALRCLEVCKRDACLEPCQNYLPECGHACPGLCGDVCPRLCPDCFAAGDDNAKNVFVKNMRTLCDTPEAVADVVSKGTDHVRRNVDTRIVQLECRCMFFVEEVLAHTQALLSVSQNGGEITAPRCPYCNENITHRTLFYTRVVKQHQQAMYMINQRKVEAKNKRSDVVRDVVAAGVVAVRSIHYALTKQRDPSEKKKDKMVVPVNVVRFVPQPHAPPKLTSAKLKLNSKIKEYELQLKHFEDSLDEGRKFWDEKAAEYMGTLPDMSPLQRCLHDASKYIFSCVRGVTTEIDTEGLVTLGSIVNVANDIATIAKVLMLHSPTTHTCLSPDEIVSLFTKHPIEQPHGPFAVFVKRFALLLRITRVMECDTSRVNVLKNARADLERVIKTNNSEDDALPSTVNADVHAVLADVDEDTQELQNLSQALSVSAGHWYQCPSGHLYVIGNCGRAMQRSVCPECGAGIGGEQHRLDSANTSAAHLLRGGV